MARGLLVVSTESLKLRVELSAAVVASSSLASIRHSPLIHHLPPRFVGHSLTTTTDLNASPTTVRIVAISGPFFSAYSDAGVQPFGE